MKKTLAFFIAILLATSPLVVEAKGGGRGGGSSGARSSASVRASASPRPSVSSPAPAPKPPAPKPPPSKPAADTPKVTKAAPVTVGDKKYSGTGNVVSPGYQPRFQGYSAPAGSVVYYPQSSALDWLPLYFILTHDAHRDVVVEVPGENGAATTTKVVEEEGVDTMYVINWIVTILFGLGLIALAMWLVNKFTNKKAYV